MQIFRKFILSSDAYILVDDFSQYFNLIVCLAVEKRDESLFLSFYFYNFLIIGKFLSVELLELPYFNVR